MNNPESLILLQEINDNLKKLIVLIEQSNKQVDFGQKLFNVMLERIIEQLKYIGRK
jgi:hypothetical protein